MIERFFLHDFLQTPLLLKSPDQEEKSSGTEYNTMKAQEVLTPFPPGVKKIFKRRVIKTVILVCALHSSTISLVTNVILH